MPAYDVPAYEAGVITQKPAKFLEGKEIRPDVHAQGQQ